jgi:hypothetical protein
VPIYYVEADIGVMILADSEEAAERMAERALAEEVRMPCDGPRHAPGLVRRAPARLDGAYLRSDPRGRGGSREAPAAHRRRNRSSRPTTADCVNGKGRET